jgi:hypothetical protein
MDGQRFDQLARLVGQGASRRNVVKGLLGLIAGGVGVALKGERALAGCQSLGMECNPEIIGHCCGNICLPTIGDGPAYTCQRPCSSVGDPCSTTGEGGLLDCCAGYVCTEGVCAEIGPQVCSADTDCDPCHACIDGACVWQCAGVCESCDASSGAHGTCVFDCRASDSGSGCCESNGTCSQETGTCQVPAECAVDADCLANGGVDGVPPICCNGTCVDAECCGDDTDGRCSTGSTCTEGVCVSTCSGDGDCASGTCCCNDGSCSADCCADPVPAPDPDPVPTPHVVTTLPKTGAGGGSESGTGNGLLGTALAAGAAALFAGRRLKSKVE